MNPGGDAAEQVVRLSLEGVEVAASWRRPCRYAGRYNIC